MLIPTRRKGEITMIGEAIMVRLLEVSEETGCVTFEVSAPESLAVVCNKGESERHDEKSNTVITQSAVGENLFQQNRNKQHQEHHKQSRQMLGSASRSVQGWPGRDVGTDHVESPANSSGPLAPQEQHAVREGSQTSMRPPIDPRGNGTLEVTPQAHLPDYHRLARFRGRISRSKLACSGLALCSQREHNAFKGQRTRRDPPPERMIHEPVRYAASRSRKASR